MPKSAIGPDGWPEDRREPLNFEDISGPLAKALRFCYNFRRRNKDKDVPWSGPNIGRSERAACLDAAYSLSAENLTYSKDEQGRDAIEEIIGLAVRLGIEQGRRIMRDSPEYHILVIKAASADHANGLLSDEKFTQALKKGAYDVFN